MLLLNYVRQYILRVHLYLPSLILQGYMLLACLWGRVQHQYYSQLFLYRLENGHEQSHISLNEQVFQLAQEH